MQLKCIHDFFFTFIVWVSRFSWIIEMFCGDWNWSSCNRFIYASIREFVNVVLLKLARRYNSMGTKWLKSVLPVNWCNGIAMKWRITPSAFNWISFVIHNYSSQGILQFVSISSLHHLLATILLHFLNQCKVHLFVIEPWNEPFTTLTSTIWYNFAFFMAKQEKKKWTKIFCRTSLCN